MQLSYGWIVVAAGMLMTCIGMGAMLSLGVFLQPMAADMAWSRSGISTAATLDFLCMGAAAFLWGMLSDRYGTRIVVLLGSALLGLGLITASRAQSLLEFQLLFGVLVGVAAGSFYAPMMSAATAWLEHRRSLAAALVSAGMGIGSMTVSPLAGWLIGAFDWRTAMLVIGVLAWTLLIPASLLVRPPPAAPQPGDGSQLAAATARDYPLSSAQAALTPQFAAIALAHFACCAAHSGPIFHMVSYATLCGLPTMLAVSVFGLAGLAGLGGRIGLGIAADRIGAKPVLVAGLLVQALAVGAYLFVESLGGILCPVDRLRPCLRRRHAALCRSRARLFRPAHHGHDVWCGRHVRKPRHGARPLGWRICVRRLGRLCLALPRLLRHWPECRRHRAGLPADALAANAATA